MNRRGFLKLLGMAAPVAAVAPKYFFAPIGGWKSDVILNPGYHFDTIIADDLVGSMVLPQASLITFYNKLFMENLKRNTVLSQMCAVVSTPFVAKTEADWGEDEDWAGDFA